MQIKVRPAGAILVANSGPRCRGTYLGFMGDRDGLLDSHLMALGRLNRRRSIFYPCHLVRRNIHPVLAVLKAGSLKLAFLHEMESGGRRGLSSRGDIGLLS